MSKIRRINFYLNWIYYIYIYIYIYKDFKGKGFFFTPRMFALICMLID